MFYKKIIRPIFFQFDPEDVHHFVITAMKVASELPPFFGIIKKFTNINDSILNTKIGNINFSNPVGLSAGFDKNVVAPLAYEMFGFGFSELGSVTFSAQNGNARPRLWRIPKDKGLIVFYGLCNIGALAVAEKLSKVKNKKHPIGVSIAPTTGLKLEEMAVDYLKSFELLAPHADFITLNVSCPNVANCDIFSQVGFIRDLTKVINDFKKEKKYTVDLFLKI
ncbi:MAG: dihydroorotate dehydrogenase (quinone), partial [Candidatus Magasanikbacteria bacterium]|nr:dihydroorotate dehydrogenase (quinone) [Candidatus Magasanikbacteria bacterium]